MARWDHWQRTSGNTKEMGVSVTSELLDGRAEKGPPPPAGASEHTHRWVCVLCFWPHHASRGSPPLEIEPTPPAVEDLTTLPLGKSPNGFFFFFLTLLLWFFPICACDPQWLLRSSWPTPQGLAKLFFLIFHKMLMWFTLALWHFSIASWIMYSGHKLSIFV